MRRAVADKGVDVSHLRTEPGSTALSHVTLVDGDRVFGDYEEGVMERFPPHRRGHGLPLRTRSGGLRSVGAG